MRVGRTYNRAAKTATQRRLRRLWEYIEANPGTTEREIRKMGRSTSILLSLELAGYLLSEDEKGGLHPWLNCN